jgi:hypothetical protein
MTATPGLEEDSGPHAPHGDLNLTAPQSSNTEAYPAIVYYQMSSFFLINWTNILLHWNPTTP